MVQPPGEPSKPSEVPVMLTSRERKKLRRQRRREAEKEKQEKIQFGLIDKPEPKVEYVDFLCQCFNSFESTRYVFFLTVFSLEEQVVV